jgi:hypothetical protein
VRRDATVRGAHGRVCRRAGATLALALSVCVCCIELEWIDARRPPWQPADLAYTLQVECAELRVRVCVYQGVPGCDGVVREASLGPAALTLTCWRAAECRQPTRP